jgi:diadenosine tetraphosphate (Ap4A) HIT family hydrolase
MLIPGCLSCDILSGKQTEPGGVIFEDEYWHIGTAVDSPAVWRGFLIIKLKRHCEQLADLTPEEALVLGSLIQSTCSALMSVLKPAKINVCSYGDGVRHIHFWVLPRPAAIRPGIHSVLVNLDMRKVLTRYLGVKKWIVSESEVSRIAKQVRKHLLIGSRKWVMVIK